MRALGTWAMVGAMATGLACGGDKVTAPLGETGAGTWIGTTGTSTLTLNLRDVAGDLRGDGTITTGSSVVAFTILDGQWSTTTAGHAMSLTFTGTSGSIPIAYDCSAGSARQCDGPARFSDGNVMYFRIER